MGSHSAHEVALLADVASTSTTRAMQARELSRKLGRARSAGHDLATLVLPAGGGELPFDLLQRHGLVAICPASGSTSSRQRSWQALLMRLGQLAGWHRSTPAAVPSCVRYGLWNVPVSRTVDLAAGSLAMQLELVAVCHAMDEAAQSKGVVHLRIDLANPSARAPEIAGLARVLKHSAPWRF
jgi:hypothetical protein